MLFYVRYTFYFIFLYPLICSNRLGLPRVGLPKVGLPTLGLPTLGFPTLGIPTLGIPTQGLPTLGLPTLGLTELGNLFYFFIYPLFRSNLCQVIIEILNDYFAGLTTQVTLFN